MKVFKAVLTVSGFALTVAFLYFEGRLSWTFAGLALIMYCISVAFHLMVHECGHFIGGKLSGYKLLRLQLGALNIIRKNNKTKVMWKRSLSGQCVMIPKETESPRFLLYNIGGIFANVLTVGLSFLLLLFNTFPTDLLFLELIFVGVQKILVNSIPHKTNSLPNDGYIIRLLKKSVAVRKDYAMYLTLYGKLFLEEEIIPQEFTYERETSADEDEMMYYNEILDILSSLE